MKIKILLIYITSCFLLSCNSYNTFFKKTGNSNSITFKKLERLNLSNTGNAIIYEQLGKCLNLHSLNLSNNANLDFEIALRLIKNPSKLKVLILDDNDLSKIPEAIIRFRNLEQLSLNKNPKLNLLSTLSKLQSLPLQFLNLQENDLAALPNTIEELKELKDLNLTNNKISDNETFKYLKKLPKLESLWLNKNELKTLPKGLFNLKNIKNLYIENNELLTIPDAIVAMQKVWVIHVGHNLLEELPLALTKMPSLLLVHANNNKIKYVPEVYGTKKSNVKGLVLNNNNIPNKTKAYLKKQARLFFILSLD